jgi:TrmH family RNA methyltransferase
MGAIFHIIIFGDGNFYSRISDLRKDGYKILVADINGENIYKYDFPDKSIMIFCNEAGGPTNKILKLSDTKITIPKKGNAESLNVASASAVILSEIMRR